jgi:hypothetical protein
LFHFHVGVDHPAKYIIKIQGRLHAVVDDWFQGEVHWEFEESTQAAGVTSLTGVIFDQAALHGLLNYLRDLGFTLLYVDCLTARGGPEADSGDLSEDDVQ